MVVLGLTGSPLKILLGSWPRHSVFKAFSQSFKIHSSVAIMCREVLCEGSCYYCFLMAEWIRIVYTVKLLSNASSDITFKPFAIRLSSVTVGF